MSTLKLVAVVVALLCIVQTAQLARIVRDAPATETDILKPNLDKVNALFNDLYTQITSVIDEKALGDTLTSLKSTLTDASKKVQEHIIDVTSKLGKSGAEASAASD